MEGKLKELIDKSSKILITSHVSPDPDSICSILLLGLSLQENFPDKNISMVSEELPDNLNYLHGFDKILTQPLNKAVEGKDLIIIVDAMNFGRCTRGDFATISAQVKKNNIPLVIIDHHEQVGVEDNAAYINDGYPAAVEQVYKTCLEDLKLSKPDGYAEITMTGLYSDTGGFTYLNGRYRETLQLVGELIDNGAKIEDAKTKLYQYSVNQLKVVSELINNLSHQDDYTYTFLSDSFVDEWISANKPLDKMHSATKIFTDNFIRNIEGKTWGFIFYRDTRLGDSMYSISFRSAGGVPNVSEIASHLAGGGHKAAAGARVEAKNANDAMQKINEVIVRSL